MDGDAMMPAGDGAAPMDPMAAPAEEGMEEAAPMAAPEEGEAAM